MRGQVLSSGLMNPRDEGEIDEIYYLVPIARKPELKS
jgi:hypothetical protein